MTILYIKTHNITGLKYFGKTQNDDPFKYNGSGLNWKKHIKEFGNNISTQIFAQFDEQDYIERILLESCALMFSSENDIVNSKEWANMKPENGLDGGSLKGRKLSDSTKVKMSASRTGKNNPMFGKTHTNEVKLIISEAHKGKTISEEARGKISEAGKGKPKSDETRRKMSESHKGKEKSDEHLANISKSRKGKIYIHNILENLCKLINPEYLDEYEKMGWVKGKLINSNNLKVF